MFSNKFFKFIFIILVIATLVVTTMIVIIIAKGGSITTDGIDTDTGMVRLHVSPETVEYKVYLNNNEISFTDKRINSLSEGEYNIRIESPNYTSWEKTLFIRKDMVSDVYAKLYPIDLKITQVTKTNIDKTKFSINGEYVFYSVVNSEIGSDKGLWSLQLNDTSTFFGTQTAEPIKILAYDPEIQKSLNEGKFELIPNADNTKLLYIDSANSLFFVLNTTELNKPPLTNIASNVGYAPTQAFWFNSGQDILFIDEKLIFAYNLNDKTKTMVYYSNNPVRYAINSTQLIVLDDTNKLLTYKDKKLSELNINGMELPSNVKQLIGTTNNDVIFVETNDGKITYVNLKKLFVKTIETEDKKLNILKINRDADATLLSDPVSGFIYVFIAFDNQAINKIETKTVKLNLSSQILKNSKQTSISFSSTGSHILINYSSTVDDKEGIVAVDKDGVNEIKLYESQDEIVRTEFNSKGNYLYLLLLTKEDNRTFTNIYKLKLDK